MIVKYRRLYPIGPYLNEEIGFEKSIPTDDDVSALATVLELKDLADRCHEKLNPSQPSISQTAETKENRIEVLIRDMQACTEVDWVNSLGVQEGLIAYANMVAGFPDLQAAYDLKMMELKKLKQ